MIGTSSVGTPFTRFGSVSGSTSGSSLSSQSSNDSVESEFTKLANMSPTERIRESILKSLGLTDDQLNALPPQQRDAIEKKISDLVKQATGGNQGNTGQNLDISA